MSDINSIVIEIRQAVFFSFSKDPEGPSGLACRRT